MVADFNTATPAALNWLSHFSPSYAAEQKNMARAVITALI